MPVCHKRKLAFCHVPRTGGVSICVTLDLTVKDRHKPVSWFREHHPDYHLFATERSYHDRIKSALGYKVPEKRRENGFKGTFDQLVTKIEKAKINGKIVKPNEHFLNGEVDTMLRFDNLETDLNNMLIKLGHEKVKLIHVNSFRNAK